MLQRLLPAPALVRAAAKKSNGSLPPPQGRPPADVGSAHGVGNGFDLTNPKPSEELRAAVEGYFDSDFYLRNYPDVGRAGLDALEHYLLFGWKELRNPSPGFDTKYYLDANPDVVAAGANPLLHYVVTGREAGRSARPQIWPAAAMDPALQVIKDHFDSEYYLRAYPDVVAAGVDPLQHFCSVGWREGRNPSDAFDTQYYLQQSPDVADAGMNPLVHFVLRGREEGRTGTHPVPIEIRSTLRDVWNARLLQESQIAAPPSHLVRTDLRISERLTAAFKRGARRLVISLSHDPYTEHCGGIQIFLSDEQRAFETAGAYYLHLAPQQVSQTLSSATEAERFGLHVTAQGESLGATTLSLVVEGVRKALNRRRSVDVVFLLHSLLGHSPALVGDFYASMKSSKSAYFWLHDYLALCGSFALMRNDIVHCGAPSVESSACGICAFGADRRAHLEQMTALFETVRPIVVAPSASALSLWKSRSPFQARKAIVHAHATMRFTRKRVGRFPAGGSKQPTLKVAFCGYPIMRKGWLAFIASVEASFAAGQPFEFHHFGATASSDRRIRHTDVRVGPDERHAMTRALREADVDIVVIPSPWPETFCYVAYEALSAGCVIATLRSSGNVAALADKLEQVLVFDDADALAKAFADGSIHVAASRLLRTGVEAPELSYDGTTSTLKELAR